MRRVHKDTPQFSLPCGQVKLRGAQCSFACGELGKPHYDPHAKASLVQREVAERSKVGGIVNPPVTLFA